MTSLQNTKFVDRSEKYAYVVVMWRSYRVQEWDLNHDNLTVCTQMQLVN